MWRVFGKCGEITPQICQARNFGAMITAAQCRSARTLLSWSLNKLASAASVPADVIDSFEMERQRPDAVTIGALQRAFEDIDDLFARMAVLGERRSGGEVDAHLDDLASGDAEIVPLQVGPLDSRLLRLRMGNW